jgi:hypothetical protein
MVDNGVGDEARHINGVGEQEAALCLPVFGGPSTFR